MRCLARVVGVVALGWLCACGGGGGGGDEGGGGDLPAASREVVVFAWNDLGMHCLNPTYDTAVILPPYNTVWAQVVRRGNPPEILTNGITVEYRMVNNSTSQKSATSPVASDFRQFWTYALDLFGVDLVPDTGLNLKDPTVHNGLAGTMLPKGDHFEVDGIPVTPLDDALAWDPYQVVEVTVKDATGAVLAQTRATVPTSDEIRCDKCHGPDPFTDILTKHDEDVGTDPLLMDRRPVLCASCHGSPALGNMDPGPGFLSHAIHSFHASRGAACYDCHPGATTQCNRSLRHGGLSGDGGCTNCHGDMAQVGDSGRIPWLSEPKCSSCHGGTTIPEVETGTTLYRDAVGHGGMSCPACHGSPHAMLPSREASDGYQAVQYQGEAITIGTCGVCHGSSRGEGLNEFGEAHGGTSPEVRNACHVCHTVVNVVPTQWPHAHKWNAR